MQLYSSSIHSRVIHSFIHSTTRGVSALAHAYSSLVLACSTLGLSLPIIISLFLKLHYAWTVVQNSVLYDHIHNMLCWWQPYVYSTLSTAKTHYPITTAKVIDSKDHQWSIISESERSHGHTGCGCAVLIIRNRAQLIPASQWNSCLGKWHLSQLAR